PSRLFGISRQLITSGLLVALLGVLGTSVNAQLPSSTTLAQTQNTSEADTVPKQLLGQWQVKDPTSNKLLTLIFAPDNNLFLVLPAPDGSSIALRVGYRVNPATQPMQLDIQLSPEQTALTIFEFTADGKLRLDLDRPTPGQPRPTAFQPNTPLFDKASEATTVPENVQVIELEAFKKLINQDAQKPEDEAKNYMYALTQVQQAHYLEQGKFAKEIEEVSIGLRTETESYRYQIVPQGDNTQSVMITAVAKDAQLPSYTGAVFVTQVNGKLTPVAQICETAQPSTSPPAMPTAPTGGSSEIQCPAGSRSLQLLPSRSKITSVEMAGAAGEEENG
ncbi:MAG: hypothetical protein F6K28_49645, partial [Microcoleus sp. SIO2G3]|nr:hypothetical protein [Microcoleus sp. SIO2G3]